MFSFIYYSLLTTSIYYSLVVIDMSVLAGDDGVSLVKKRKERQNKMLEDVKIVLRDKLDLNMPLDDEGTTLVGRLSSVQGLAFFTVLVALLYIPEVWSETGINRS